jgi:hypothetical protein
MIQYPRWISPAPLVQGDALQVLVLAEAGLKWTGFLVNGESRYALVPSTEIACPSNLRLRQLTFALSADVTAGLYDLQLISEAGVAVDEPNCVWMQAADGGEFRLVHMSDLHIWSGEGEDRSHLVERLVRHLRRDVRPDLILNTGDLISRYDSLGRPHSKAAIALQLRIVRRHLLSLRIPQFVTPGNHDVAFPFIRRLWNRWMGGSPDGESDNLSFAFRGARFLGLDRSLEYDRNHGVVRRRMTACQRQWLTAELEKAAGAARLFVFCHYDYEGELAPLLDNWPVDLVFYGHSSQPCLPEHWRDRDGGLRNAQLYQEIQVGGTGLVRQPAVTAQDLLEI